jgi:DNA-binding transcriptional regulator GbsR (MarR family)
MGTRPHPSLVLGDRLGRFFAANGLPRTAGRVVGYLLVCDPPAQTFDDIVAAIGASRSTVSVATRLLLRLGLLERFGVPGERRDRYHVPSSAWTSLLEQDLAAATELKRIADDGLALLGGASQASRTRLRDMKKFFAFLEAAYVPIRARWNATRDRATARRRRP